MKIQLDGWQSNFIWNLLNEELGKMITEKRLEASEKVVELMNKLDPEYEEED